MELNLALLDHTKRYILGVSGGPDSMAMLDMFARLHFDVVVCLVNYHKREDSDLDYEVVRDYCLNQNIPLAYKEIFDYKAGNFQAQARILRYDFYFETLKKYDATAVCLAHHKDDYLESALMAKDRGMDEAPWGILESSMYKDMVVLRPLMHVYKEDLKAYCETHHIAYRIDSSNLESHYTRNYYRNEILSHYDLQAKQALYEMVIDHNLQVALNEKKCQAYLKQPLTLSLLKQFEDPVMLLGYYLRHIEGLDSRLISKRLIQDAYHALLSDKPNVRYHLPVNFVLIKAYDNIVASKQESSTFKSVVLEEGESYQDEWIQVAFDGPDRSGIAPKKEDYPLVIRTRLEGDTIALSYGEKKLSRLFIDAKIPLQKRDTWPVVVSASGQILLVPQIAKNKGYLLVKPTFFVLQ